MKLTFSPLFIAVWNVTMAVDESCAVDTADFQSAFHRGMECYEPAIKNGWLAFNPFSPLFIAVWNVTFGHRYATLQLPRLSVRFSSRYGMLPQTTRAGCSAMLLSVRFSSRYGMLRDGVKGFENVLPLFQSAFHRGMECYH